MTELCGLVENPGKNLNKTVEQVGDIGNGRTAASFHL